MITNKIVTRGMGPSRGVPGRASLITQGYGGVFTIIFTAQRQAVHVGRAARKKIDDIVVFARLVRINQKQAYDMNIKGSVRVVLETLSRKTIKLAETISVKTIKTIRVLIDRIK